MNAVVNGEFLMLGIAGTELSVAETELFRRLQPAGYVLFSRNISTAAQTRALTDSLRALSPVKPIIAIDQEGGRVSRLAAIAPYLPSAKQLAETKNYKHIITAATLTAQALRLLGINLNLAPVLDIDHFATDSTVLSGRSWGTEPQAVINYAGTWNRHLRFNKIAGCAKHFPSCTASKVDPHFDLPTSQTTIPDLMRQDVIPYTALMPELDCVMITHAYFPNIDSELPTSLSPTVVTQFLRNRLGYDSGIVLTDDLDMQAISNKYARGHDAYLAILAGCDLALICHRTETAPQAAEALAQLPNHIKCNSRERIAEFRHRKISSPLAWSDAAWEQVRSSIADFSALFDSSTSTENYSPVAKY